MFDKLFQAQQKVEEIKSRLDTISVVGEAEGGLIRVTATANKDVTDIFIDPDFLAKTEKEALEELLVVAVNNVIKQAENIGQTEMQAATKDMLGGMGGLFGQ